MRVIKFAAEWCMPCQAYGPIFDTWANKQMTTEIYKFDVEKDADIATQYRVMSVPTTILEDDNGKVINMSTNVMTEVELNEFLETGK